MWSVWFGVFLFNGWFTIQIADIISFPLIVVVAVMILMEIVPILWVIEVIPHSVFFDRSLVGGFWLFGQLLICGFFFYATSVFSTSLMSSVIAVIVILGIGWNLAYYRTMLEIRLLLLYKE